MDYEGMFYTVDQLESYKRVTVISPAEYFIAQKYYEVFKAQSNIKGTFFDLG